MKKVITTEEIQTLVSGLILHKEDGLYSHMCAKALLLMSSLDDVDEMFLDMSDSALHYAREQDEGDARDYYTVSFLLRRVAHQVYRKYIREGKQRESERFLRSV